MKLRVGRKQNRVLLDVSNSRAVAIFEDKHQDLANLVCELLNSYDDGKPMTWVKFNFDDLSTRPKEYGKYLVCRKDGKIHWETWNGSGWAYNHKVITHWAIIIKPES